MTGNSRSSSEIESDIRRTRGRMDATLDELGSRLTARSVIHTLLDLWEARTPETPRSSARTRRVTGAVSQQVLHQVRENPVPSLLIGAGIAWMLMDRMPHSEREYVDLGGRRYRVDPSIPSGPAMPGAVVTEYEYEDLDYDEIDNGPSMIDRAKAKISQGKEAVTDAAAAARERVSGLGESAKERMSEGGESASEAARLARRRARDVYNRGRDRGRILQQRVHSGYDVGAEKFSDALDEYPLGVGIGFAALGAIVGLLLPHTRREDELLGERSDEILDVVKEKGKETLERTKAVAERVAETALDEAQRQGFTPEAASQKLSELASKAGEVAKRVKDEAAQAAEENHLRPEKSQSSGTGIPSSGFTPGTASGGISPGSASTLESEGQSVTMPPKSASYQEPL